LGAASGGAASGAVGAASAQTSKAATLSTEKMVAALVTLMQNRGKTAEAEIRKRIAQGRTITVKGIEFPVGVLQEALRKRDAGLGSAVPPLAEAPPESEGKAAGPATGSGAGAVSASFGRPLKRRISESSQEAPKRARTAASASASVAMPKAAFVSARAPAPPQPQPQQPREGALRGGRRSISSGPAAAGAALAAPPAAPLRLPRVSLGRSSPPSASREPDWADEQARPGGREEPAAPSFQERVQATLEESSARRRVERGAARRRGAFELRFSPERRPTREAPARPPPARGRGEAEASKDNDAPKGQLGGGAAAPEERAVGSLSVKELKALLGEHDLGFAGAVEKAELQALWSQFALFLTRPLVELQTACGAQGARGLTSVEACAHFLVSPSPSSSSVGPSAAAAAPAATPAVAVGHAADMEAAQQQREQVARRNHEAEVEVERILRARKENFVSLAAWGFVVLDVAERSTAAVQRGYRALMKRLHPDKVGQAPKVVLAVELVREAKDLCERALCSLEMPPAPRQLKTECLNSTKGQRKFKLSWSAPLCCERAPVRRYVVAAVDPAYGKALTITILEPDYNQELSRYVGVEELTSFILAEEELQKMPSLWQQRSATVQVAASNEAGQSPWTTLQVPLNGSTPPYVPPPGFTSFSTAASVNANTKATRAPPRQIGTRVRR